MSFGNGVNFCGRLVNDVEIRTFGENRVCNFTLARNRTSTKDKEVDFVDCVAWNGVADLIEKFVKKGNRLGVNGRIQTRTFEDKNGVKRKVVEIIAESIEFIETNKDTSSSNERPTEKFNKKENYVDETESADDEGDDLPF